MMYPNKVAWDRLQFTDNFGYINALGYRETWRLLKQLRSLRIGKSHRFCGPFKTIRELRTDERPEQTNGQIPSEWVNGQWQVKTRFKTDPNPIRTWPQPNLKLILTLDLN